MDICEHGILAHRFLLEVPILLAFCVSSIEAIQVLDQTSQLRLWILPIH